MSPSDAGNSPSICVSYLFLSTSTILIHAYLTFEGQFVFEIAERQLVTSVEFRSLQEL